MYGSKKGLGIPDELKTCRSEADEKMNEMLSDHTCAVPSATDTSRGLMEGVPAVKNPSGEGEQEVAAATAVSSSSKV